MDSLREIAISQVIVRPVESFSGSALADRTTSKLS